MASLDSLYDSIHPLLPGLDLFTPDQLDDLREAREEVTLETFIGNRPDIFNGLQRALALPQVRDIVRQDHAKYVQLLGTLRPNLGPGTATRWRNWSSFLDTGKKFDQPTLEAISRDAPTMKPEVLKMALEKIVADGQLGRFMLAVENSLHITRGYDSALSILDKLIQDFKQYYSTKVRPDAWQEVFNFLRERGIHAFETAGNATAENLTKTLTTGHGSFLQVNGLAYILGNAVGLPAKCFINAAPDFHYVLSFRVLTNPPGLHPNRFLFDPAMALLKGWEGPISGEIEGVDHDLTLKDPAVAWLSSFLAETACFMAGSAGVMSEAIKLYDQAIALTPDDVLVHVNFAQDLKGEGQECLIRGERQKAQDYFKRARAELDLVHPHIPEDCSLQSDIKRILGYMAMAVDQDYETAKRLFKEALQVGMSSETETTANLLALLELEIRRGNQHASETLIERLRPRLSSRVFYGCLGKIYLSANEYYPAERYYRLALAEDPKMVQVMSNLAWVLYQTSRANESRALCEQILRLVPQHEHARDLLAKINGPGSDKGPTSSAAPKRSGPPQYRPDADQRTHHPNGTRIRPEEIRFRQANWTSALAEQRGRRRPSALVIAEAEDLMVNALQDDDTLPTPDRHKPFHPKHPTLWTGATLTAYRSGARLSRAMMRVPGR